jgi:DNA-binding CsgD family transcriptional regulator
VFIEALEGRLFAGELEKLKLTESDREILPTIFPALRPDETTSAPAQPDERHHLLRAMHSLLEALATERPLVLALDDLHWADSASIDLVCRLLHRRLRQPSLLLLASRPAQTEPRLRIAFEEAERSGNVRRMDLAPLSRLEAQELLHEVGDRELTALLYRQSGGNPLYLRELAAASERGALTTTVSGVEAGTSTIEVPAGVSAAIRAEVGALSRPARSLLQGAACVGEPFEADLAADACGIVEEEALPALDELLEKDLLRHTESPRRFRFRHPIVWQAVYETAGAGWRLAAHRRAVAALEARGAPASIRAAHVERCARKGDRDAITVLTQAGEETITRAPASAAHWFEVALALTPEEEANVDLRLELIARRAAALGIGGRIEESRAALHEFLALSPDEPSDFRLQAAVLAAILDELLGAQAIGRRLLLDELTRLPDRDGPAAAELKRELAFTCFFDADWAEMARWAREALSGQCEGMVKVGALAGLALAQFGLVEVDDAHGSVENAAALFDALSDDEVAAHHPGIAIWLGWAEVCTERFGEAIRHLDRGIIVSRAAGQRHLTVGLLAVQGQALALAGRGEELSAVVEAATEAALLSASELFLGLAMTLRCQASLQAGDLYDALHAGERGAVVAAAGSSPLSGIARVQLAAALLEMGEPLRCREQLTSRDGNLDLPPFRLYETYCLELLVRSEIALGDRKRAEELAGYAERVAERLGLQLPLAHARRARAAVLLEYDEPGSAVPVAVASYEAAARAGAQVEAARGKILAGKALAAAGEREAAITELDAAHSQLAGCGAFRYCDEAARELRKLGRAVARAGVSPEGGLLGLSRRELEVMELVAAGMTNRAIADELFISVRTVDRHLSRIFGKLDVKSRAAAASLFERARSGSAV